MVLWQFLVLAFLLGWIGFALDMIYALLRRRLP
jgi:hypothetical protein